MAQERSSPNFSFHFEDQELPPKAPAHTSSNDTGGLYLSSPSDLLPNKSLPIQPAPQRGQHLAEGLGITSHHSGSASSSPHSTSCGSWGPCSSVPEFLSQASRRVASKWKSPSRVLLWAA